MNVSILELQHQMKKVLSEQRYVHTLGVQHTAACLGMCYQVNFEQTNIAGLLHDCAKYMDGDGIKKRCEKLHLPMNETERKNPSLLHAKLGAYYAETKYGIKDQDILNAIRYHTTGCPNMSCLEEIIFVADYIEPGRKPIKGLNEIRNLAFLDLRKSVYQILENTLLYLNNASKGALYIDPMTQNTYDYYKNLFM